MLARAAQKDARHTMADVRLDGREAALEIRDLRALGVKIPHAGRGDWGLLGLAAAKPVCLKRPISPRRTRTRFAPQPDRY